MNEATYKEVETGVVRHATTIAITTLVIMLRESRILDGAVLDEVTERQIADFQGAFPSRPEEDQVDVAKLKDAFAIHLRQMLGGAAPPRRPTFDVIEGGKS